MIRRAAAAALVAAALAGCAGTPADRFLDGRRAASSPTATAGAGSHGDGYDRPLFGKAWDDVDRNNCDTRNDTLAVWMPDETLAANGCTVTAGTFTDPYNGRVLTFRIGTPQPVQIDHVIPLHLAWHWGADRWTPADRLLFANDPSNLIPTTLNGTKGDQSPAQLARSESNPDSKWKPTAEGRCLYARTFALAAAEWNLDVPATDRDAIATALRACPGSQ